MKRTVKALLIIPFIALVCGCGSPDIQSGALNSTDQTGTDKTEEAAAVDNPAVSDDLRLFIGSEGAKIGDVSTPIDIDAVYNSIPYTNEMFNGYFALNCDDDYENYKAEMDYIEDTSGFSYNPSGLISAIPFKIYTGNALTNVLKNDRSYPWMELYYMTKDGDLLWLDCSYEVDGKKLTVHALKEWNYDQNTDRVTYTFSDMYIEYDIRFRGNILELSKDGKSVELTGNLIDGETKYKIDGDGYLSENSPQIEWVDGITIFPENESGWIYINDQEGNTSYDCAATISSDGIFTLTLNDGETVKTSQYAYIYGGEGIILADENEVYYYNKKEDNRTSTVISNVSLEDQDKLEKAGKDAKQALSVIKEDLISDLASAFTEKGIDAYINDSTGEICLDAVILFAGDSAVLSDDGKDLYSKFISAYLSIIGNEKYNGLIKQTIIEGHTAPLANSTYESGLPLSEERANAVYEYSLSPELGLTPEEVEIIKNTFSPVGYSNSRPILDENGNVDLNASRRVSFRFLIDIDKL